MTKIKPFDFIYDLASKKTNLIKSSEVGNVAEKSYIPYITNRAFCQHADTIMAANLMNRYRDLDSRLQHDYYFYDVRKKYRKFDWPKKNNEEDVNIISEIYNINKRKAQDYLRLLSDDQLDQIRKFYKKGGTDYE